MMQDTFVVDRQKLEVVQERVFEAARARVWKAFTDPEILPRWWGPRAYSTWVDKMDVRPGGEWRYVQHDAQGNEFAFHGEYLEVREPERLVYTFIYEPQPQQVITATVTLEALSDQQTRLTEVSRFETLEALEGMIQEGMEWGARESLERLAEVVEGLKERD